jgi:hypothetical protein
LTGAVVSLLECGDLSPLLFLCFCFLDSDHHKRFLGVFEVRETEEKTEKQKR